MPFISHAKDGSTLLHIYVQPKASKTRVVGLHDGLLKIAITAPPVDGKANREIVKFLAKCLKVSKGDVVLKSGAQARRKTFIISAPTGRDIRAMLGAFIDS